MKNIAYIYIPCITYSAKLKVPSDAIENIVEEKGLTTITFKRHALPTELSREVWIDLTGINLREVKNTLRRQWITHLTASEVLELVRKSHIPIKFSEELSTILEENT